MAAGHVSENDLYQVILKVLKCMHNRTFIEFGVGIWNDIENYHIQ